MNLPLPIVLVSLVAELTPGSGWGYFQAARLVLVLAIAFLLALLGRIKRMSASVKSRQITFGEAAWAHLLLCGKPCLPVHTNSNR